MLIEAVIEELGKLAAEDPVTEVRQAALEARQKLYRKLELFDREVPALAAAEEAGREQSLEETRAFISHEVRSAIGPLKTVTELLQKRLTETGVKDDKLAEYTDRILKQTDTAYRVVSEYVDYTRPLRPELQATDVAKLLRESLAEIRADCQARGTEIAEQLQPNLRARLDRELMKQVLRNILSNALEAMTGAQQRLTLAAGRDGGWISIEVSDTGTGIKPEHLPRLFELGFTTKLGQQGAGIGLALSRRIVYEAHGGQISAANNQTGPGAAVKIRLRAAEEG